MNTAIYYFSATGNTLTTARMLRQLLPEATAERVTGFDHLKPEALALARFQRFDGDLTRLVYIRPAVFPKAEV